MPKEPQGVEAQISNLRRWHRTLTKEVQTLSKENKAAIQRLDRLNGSVDKIHEAADTLEQLQVLAPKLERIAQQLNPVVIDTVLSLASKQKEHDDWWTGTRSRLNPLRPIGAAFWTVFLGVVIWGISSQIFR